MCFGSKDEAGDDPAPKPVRHAQATPDRRDVKQSNPYGSSAPATEGGPSQFDYAPPPGPPPGNGNRQHEYAPPTEPPPGRSGEFAPPSGPPPSHRRDEYAPPPGPPPGERDQYVPPAGPPPGFQDGYASPPGPPPPHRQDDYAPPSGPPPTSSDWDAPPPGPPPVAKPLHDWQTAVPDTSLFPPPPAIFSGFDRSPTSNASVEEAVAGEEWCERYALTSPISLDQPARTALQSSNFRLIEPAGFNGKLNWLGPGRWEGSTAKSTPDRCIIGYPPLYVVNEHNPLILGHSKTIYYEVKIRSDSRDVLLGLGFTALPYPSFRMPGWHRGSLAVHGDDGHKYINDRWGGKTFTDKFRKGDTYGIGMTLSPTGADRAEVVVFFTRNGTRVGEWDVHEETDAEQDMPVIGLEGFHDLSCAIGTYDSVSFEVIFDPAQWKYKLQ